MGSIEAKRLKGRPVSAGEAREAIIRVLGSRLMRAAQILMRTGMQETPRISGNLQRSWAVGTPQWDNSKFGIRLGPRAIYARRVNLTSIENEGYLERGYDAGKDQAQEEVSAGVRELLPELWRND